MSNIKPFKAIHYNTKKIKDIEKVVAPPYDVISSEEQAFYHNLSPFNFTHVDLGLQRPGDDAKDNVYTRAKTTFDDWLAQEVMIRDTEPSVYFCKQDYKVRGERHSRLGFVSLMELQDEADSKVRPHENTHAHAVDDRFQLTKALDANLSCIFVCYSDQQKKVDKIFHKSVVTEEPLIDVMDQKGVRNRLWRLSDPQLIQEINASLQGQNLFIADGHHRYQVAQDYRRLRLEEKGEPLTGQEPYNYVMTYFTNLDSRDLQIFPMHRIVKKIPKGLDFLEEFFRMDKVKNDQELMILLAKAGRNEHAFGLYTRDGIKLLRLKNKLMIQDHVKEGSPEYKSLDAAILKSFVFDRIGVKPADIQYTSSIEDATQAVDTDQAAASFIMNPVKISQLKAIALNGERMPPKTTYFYPKVLSGLTVYKM